MGENTTVFVVPLQSEGRWKLVLAMTPSVKMSTHLRLALDSSTGQLEA